MFLTNMRRATKFLGEAALKYFLVQTFGSVVLITVCLLNSLNFLGSELAVPILIFALIVKLGVAPFHSWRIRVGAGISWSAFFTLITVQKLNPFIIIISLPSSSDILFIGVVVRLAVGAFGGLVQGNFKSILVYSSINHLGWLIVASIVRLDLFLVYILIYALALYVPVVIADMNIIDDVADAAHHEEPILNQCIIGARILSLAGLPPFLGFFPKWLVLQELISWGRVFVPLVMIFCSVLILYLYLRIGFRTVILATFPEDWDDTGDVTDLGAFFFLLCLCITLTLGGLPLVFLL